jgi:hypothetical protein
VTASPRWPNLQNSLSQIIVWTLNLGTLMSASSSSSTKRRWFILCYLKHELLLKLLSTVDGYLLAVRSRKPMLTHLAARYALELLAIVYSLAKELEAAKGIELREWEQRGNRFLSVLSRGRYASHVRLLTRRVYCGVSRLE